MPDSADRTTQPDIPPQIDLGGTVTTHASTWNDGSSTGRAAPGTVIGERYTLHSAVGHGGMGSVWRATDTVLRREVAVKEVVLPPNLAETDRRSMYERTLREARAAASLAHPSVVQVFDVVIEGGKPWIVMELLDARSLADMVIEDGPLAPRAVAKIGIALLGALEVAHASGVLHRDVKPANVLITKEGRCVLTDFGVAKLPTDVQLTTPGMVLGSPHFISPERALGHRFGPPSDLFSLGVTLYTAVEGRPPFDKGDPLATMHAVVEEEPVSPVRCGPLRPLLYGLMDKDPDRRWTVPAARSALRELLGGPLAQLPSQPGTDPWAVISTPQTTTAWVTPPATSAPAKQIGGRALLHTGESPTSRSGRHTAAGPTQSPDQPTGAFPAPTGAMPVAAQTWADMLGRLVRRCKVLPRRIWLAIGAGVAGVALLATVSWAMLGDDGTTPDAQAGSPSPSKSAKPPAEVRNIIHRGVKIAVPKTWKQVKAGTYVDYRDPADKDRWLRINVTDERDARRALESADRTFPKKFCTDGYEQIHLTEAELGGVTGAELEFQCRPKGKELRHGLWRIAIVDGKACHVYLSTWEATFEDDKDTFDQAVASFASA